jgi:hypothetical protein
MRLAGTAFPPTSSRTAELHLAKFRSCIHLHGEGCASKGRRPMRSLTGWLASATIFICAGSAHALTMQECSAKYRAAQSAGTLNGMKWNDFRKAECGSNASTAASPAPAANAPAPAAAPTRAPVGTAPTAPGVPTNAVFPSSVSPKYSSESAGKARMHTCLDQYKANKATNANGGLNWIQRGGGYYSECNKRLKG